MSKHSIEPEELQAYLDRELAAGREAEVERHLSECRECQAVLGDLKRVSETLQRWQVEPAPASLQPPALEVGAVRPERPALEAGLLGRMSRKQIVWGLAGAAAVAALVLGISVSDLLRSPESLPQQTESPAVLVANKPSAPPPPPAAEPPKLALSKTRSAPAPTEADRQALARSREKFEEKEDAVANGEVAGALGGVAGSVSEFKVEPGRAADEAAPVGTPAANRALAMKSSAAPAAEQTAAPRLIAYWVTMTVEVQEFEAAKAKALQTVEGAGGYVAEASSSETPNQPRRSDLTVRVPAAKLGAVLEALRGLGRVVHEQLSSEEVTAQVVDLEARLRNARATEDRLIRVLDERTGKVKDILEVEREISSTREEIERLEAQRQNLRQRVEFSTVRMTLVEEFKAQLAPAPVGTPTRLRNAFIEGYENFAGLLLGFVFFFARYGLTLLFWLGCLCLGWRLVRRPLWRLVSTRG